MTIFNDARVVALLADYANVDAAGKINALGAAFQITGMQATGFTAPMYLVILMDIPSRYVGEQFTFSVELRDEATDAIVRVPGPTGALEPFRITQAAQVSAPNAPSIPYLPADVPSRTNMLMAFPNGVQVVPGHSYRWVVKIDGQGRSGWYAGFHVPGPPPTVFGGMDNPTGTEELHALFEPDQGPAPIDEDEQES